jgi:hypothetical protein
MTPGERDQFTKLCRRILEAADHRTFIECVEELRVFLGSVLPPEECKTELSKPTNRSLK